jgi:hypothetical protein
MPALVGKVMVVDPKPLDKFIETGFAEGGPISTYIYNPDEPFHAATADTNPGIPATTHHVELSYGDFDRFTTITPDGSPGPTLAHNPFIGPNPVAQLDVNPQVADNPPGVSIDYKGLHSGGSFLFDSGAAASFISTKLAGDLGVQYKDGTFGSDDPVLEGVPLDEQFDLIIGGIGGTVTASGFFLDHLVLHTAEGGPADDDPNNIRFVHAPVLVADISLLDPDTQQTLTIDGVFGMNFLVASLFLDGFSFGDIGLGSFNWITFDEPNGVLGLSPKGAPVPEPGSLALAGAALAMFAAYAWRRRRLRSG